jgi:hypothetical protein
MIESVIAILFLVFILVGLYFIFGPKEYPGDSDVIVEIPVSEIPAIRETAPIKIVLHDEKLAEIPVHKVIHAKVRKVLKKTAKKRAK